MKTAFLALLMLVFTGCASFTSGNVQTFAPVIKATASVATGQTLVRLKDRQRAAELLYGISTGALVISGTVPTKEELAASLSLAFGDSANEELTALAVTLATLYADYYEQLATGENVKASGLILQSIAAGISSAAAAYK